MLRAQTAASASAGGARCNQMVTVIAFLVCGVGGQWRKSIGRETGLGGSHVSPHRCCNLDCRRAGVRPGAAELKVMGAGPVEGTVKELVPAFVHETGHKVDGVFNTVGFIQERLKAGERPDILILSAFVMEAMEKDGSLVTGSRTEIGRATSGFAVRAGAPTPDISTPDAMKKTLLAARAVAYVDPAGGGTTGVFFAGLLTRLGIADEINRKAIRPQRGAQVAEAVADGRAEIGNTNLTELVPHKGVKVIGPIPEPLGLVITYVGGILQQAPTARPRGRSWLR
jgi:molybdate transport system substrate-binding protein